MSNSASQSKLNEISSLRNVKDRLLLGFTNACRSIAALVIFAIVVVGAGGLGIWIPMFTYKDEIVPYKATLAVALATYYLAILATLFADLTYDVFQRLILKREEEIRPSTQVGLWFAFFGVGSLLFAGAIVSLILPPSWENLAFAFSVVGTIVGLILWLVINGESGKYNERALDKYYNTEAIVDDKLSGKGVANDGLTSI